MKYWTYDSLFVVYHKPDYVKLKKQILSIDKDKEEDSMCFFNIVFSPNYEEFGRRFKDLLFLNIDSPTSDYKIMSIGFRFSNGNISKKIEKISERFKDAIFINMHSDDMYISPSEVNIFYNGKEYLSLNYNELSDTSISMHMMILNQNFDTMQKYNFQKWKVSYTNLWSSIHKAFESIIDNVVFIIEEEN